MRPNLSLVILDELITDASLAGGPLDFRSLRNFGFRSFSVAVTLGDRLLETTATLIKTRDVVKLLAQHVRAVLPDLDVLEERIVEGSTIRRIDLVNSEVDLGKRSDAVGSLLRDAHAGPCLFVALRDRVNDR